jgi:hypothetical protein
MDKRTAFEPQCRVANNYFVILQLSGRMTQKMLPGVVEMLCSDYGATCIVFCCHVLGLFIIVLYTATFSGTELTSLYNEGIRNLS